MIELAILLILYIVGIRLYRAHRRDWILRATEDMRASTDAVREQIGERLLPTLAESAHAFDDLAAAMARSGGAR